MSFSFRPARRTEAKPLIALYAPSGAGKTMSALLLARGFVGEKGRIGMIDSESGRGEVYADMIPGGYDVLPIRDDFSPASYGSALKAAEQAKYDALIIDSASHEWSGAGGVLSMAAANQEAGKKGVIVWQAPKLQHSRRFILPLLQTPIPLVILCLRARKPMIEKKMPDGKKEWVRSEEYEPDQAEDILFECFVHGWIDNAHKFHATKYTRPDLADIIKDGERISLTTGKALAKWTKQETTESPGATPPRTPDDAAPDDSTPQPPPSSGAAPLPLAEMAREAAMRGRDVFLKFYQGRSNLEQAELRLMKPELEALYPTQMAAD
jgi:hypothetical protein